MRISKHVKILADSLANYVQLKKCYDKDGYYFALKLDGDVHVINTECDSKEEIVNAICTHIRNKF